jgi:hypothetical protein
MRRKTIISIAINIICVIAISLQAQIEMAPSVLSSSGGYGENENFSISWTLGELAITTLRGENFVLTQGFQQPSDFGVGIKKNEIDWNISAYPNPVHKELNILFDLRESKDFLLELQDVTGRFLKQESHQNVNAGDLVILNTSDLIGGVYFLRILTTDLQQVKVISISKL